MMQFPQVRSSFHENWTAFFPQKSVNNHSLFSFLKSRQFWQSKHFKIKSQCKSRARWKCQVLTRWFCSSSFSVFSPENDAFPASKHILHVLRTLRKEHYSQAEIDQLFISVVLPNFSYALSVYQGIGVRAYGYTKFLRTIPWTPFYFISSFYQEPFK